MFSPAPAVPAVEQEKILAPSPLNGLNGERGEAPTARGSLSPAQRAGFIVVMIPPACKAGLMHEELNGKRGPTGRLHFHHIYTQACGLG